MPNLKPIKAWVVTHNNEIVNEQAVFGHGAGLLRAQTSGVYPNRLDAQLVLEHWKNADDMKITPVLITPIKSKRKP